MDGERLVVHSHTFLTGAASKGIDMSRSWRITGQVASLGVGIALALHVALLAAWIFSIEPELAAAPHAERLEVDRIEAFPPSPGDWSTLALAGLRLRAPLRGSVADLERRCAAGCRLPLQQGTLTLFDAPRTESYDHTLRLLAPDRRDVSPWSPPWRNWGAIRALAERISVPNVLPPSVRYAAPRSRGVVTYFDNNDVERWVIYAYARHARASRVLAVSNAARETFRAILGSVIISAE
jgi:hypothetical protein